MIEFHKIPILSRIGLLGFLFFFGLNCGFEEKGKIPITTTSEIARDLYIEGRALTEKLRGQEAIYFYLRALAEDPKFALANLNMAFAQPSPKGYFKYFNRAKAMIDYISEGEQLWILAQEAGVNGDPVRQRELYRKIVTLYPNDELAHNLLGNQYFNQQDYRLAIDEYMKAISINPNLSQPYNQLGYSYRFLGLYSEAETAFKKYIDLIPDDPNPYDSYAEFLLKMGKYKDSIGYYRKALKANINFAPSYIGIATNLMLTGKHAEARNQLQLLYDNALHNGQRRNALFVKAMTYVDEGNTQQALIELEKQFLIAEIIDDKIAMANDLNFMGLILVESGNAEASKEKFKTAINLISESDVADEIKRNFKLTYFYNSALVLLAEGKAAQAQSLLEQYRSQVEIKKNPAQFRLCHQISGLIALSKSEFDIAIKEFDQTDQQNAYNIFWIAQAYEGKNDTVQALDLYYKVRDFNTVGDLSYAFVRNKAKDRINLLQGD